MQHEYNATQHEYNATQHEYNATQHEYNSTMRCNTSKTKLSTSTKEARTAKIGLYITLFVTELYLFLIFFGNSYYSPICNIFSTLWMSKVYNTSLRNVKQSKTYDVLRKVQRLADAKLKIAIQVPKTYIYPPLSCFINNLYSFWKLIFGHQVRKSIKLEKVVIILKRISNSFFIYIFRTILRFRNSIFRMIHRSSSP